MFDPVAALRLIGFVVGVLGAVLSSIMLLAIPKRFGNTRIAVTVVLIVSSALALFCIVPPLIYHLGYGT